MTEIMKPTSGTFCWVELATTDPAAGKRFYQELLGWNTNDLEMGITYTLADIGDGKYVAGMMELPPPAKAMGAPPRWMGYVAVADIPAAIAKATSLGGKVVHGPMQMGPGSQAVLQDPAGGVFSIWHDPDPKNIFVYGATGALCWNELISTNLDVAAKFYADLFGWKLERSPMEGMEYTLAKLGDVQVGGMMAQPEEMAGAPSMWNVYFAVTDCDATVAKTKGLGGKVVVPPMDIPSVGRFATLADPQGATFSILQPAVA